MNPCISCVILDDEVPATRLLAHHVKDTPSLELIGVFNSPSELLRSYVPQSTDLLFLDINMPSTNGFELLNQLPIQPLVVFVSAEERFAIQSYEYDAVDYLLKPISFSRFSQAVHKVMSKLNMVQSSALDISPITEELSQKSYMWVRNERKTRKVFFNQILYIESAKEYVIFHTPQEKIIVRDRLQKILDILPSLSFVQIHKSFVISLDFLQSYTKTGVTVGNQDLPVGQKYRDAFTALLAQNINAIT